MEKSETMKETIKQEIVSACVPDACVAELYANTETETDFMLYEPILSDDGPVNRISVRFEAEKNSYRAEIGLWLRVSDRYLSGKVTEGITFYECVNLLKLISAGIRQADINRLFAA
ncbi:MAG: hypothetical protein LBT55_05355 [Clostridiaceae bacterium]|jgi:hypothetical protein|nr:hypothetical protein [Clostridiaceae bacterium]